MREVSARGADGSWAFADRPRSVRERARAGQTWGSVRELGISRQTWVSVGSGSLQTDLG